MKISILRHILIGLCIFLSSEIALAQTFVWANNTASTSAMVASDHCIDAFNNIVTTGSYTNTCDLDPGSGVINVTTAGLLDIYIQKFDKNGLLKWGHSIGTTTDDKGEGVSVDNSGNVFITGSFLNTVDFNPGGGTASLTSNGNSDAFILKLDSNGSYIWVKQIGGTQNDIGLTVKTDNAGNVYCLGTFRGIVDMDPGAGITNDTANGTDAFVLKLNSSGNYIWSKKITGTQVFPQGLEIDNSLNVLVAGYYGSTIDLNPSSAVSSFTANGSNDVFVTKWSATGNYIFGKSIGGLNNDQAEAFHLDNTGIYLGGRFGGTVDFDPGVGVNEFIATSTNNGFLVKLDNNGDFSFASQIESSSLINIYDIATSSSNEIYFGGRFSGGTIDADPGLGVNNLTQLSNADGFQVKLSNSGLFEWASTISSSTANNVYSMVVDSENNLISFGKFGNTVDFDPSSNTLNLSPGDVYLQKLSPCTTPNTVNAGTNQNLCSSASTVSLNGTVGGGTSMGVWSGGAGTFSPNASTLNATYTPTAGEISSQSIVLTLTSTGNADCPVVFDDITISYSPIPTANAGSNQTYCSDVTSINLTGSFNNAGGVVWSGGNGVYTPNSTTSNATYAPTAAEKASGSLTLTLSTTGNGACSAATHAVTFTFDPAPSANAGPNQSLCANTSTVTLNGSVLGGTGGTWSGGAGTFNPNANSLNAIYTPSAGELAALTVTLTLTSTGNGVCSSSSDNITINYSAIPSANAGNNQTFCSDVTSINLTGSSSNSGGVIWSGGNGVYSPNSTTANATYEPTAAEKASGSLTLTLSTTGNGACSAASDAVTYTFDPAPSANAGTDQDLCASSSTASLNGSILGASGGIWTGGSGTFSPIANSLNAIYTPTAGEISAGSVQLILTSTGNGICSAASDTVNISFSPVPNVNAGPNQSICANNSSTTLSGSVTAASGGIWSGGSGTFTPNASVLNAIYTPSAAEITAGSVTLTLTSAGNAICSPSTDNITINFTPSPIVNAGTDQTVCVNNPTLVLNGSVSNAGGGQWTGGAGTFTPNANTLNATYIPSVAEIAAGSVALTLSSTNNGNCNPSSDIVNFTFTPLPLASAGADQSICENNSTVQLAGSVVNASGGAWTSSGTGVFVPNTTSLNAIYVPSASDLIIGSSTLTLITTGNGNCGAISDSIVLTYTPAPNVTAGLDLTVCSNNAIVTLNGSVANAIGGQWSGGTGTFTPNSTTLNATYTPSVSEIASGTISLILTSTGNGSCIPETDTVLINFTPSPTVIAGINDTLCVSNPLINLNGLVTVASGGNWSTASGQGIFSPGPNSLTGTFNPSASQLNSGSVILTLTSTGNGNCLAVSDSVKFTFDPLPTADAGPDQSVCDNIGTVQLNGTVTNATGGVWNTVGSGTFSPNAITLNAIYIPSAQDLANGIVNITLASFGSGLCAGVFDQMNINFNAVPSVDLGIDTILCSNFLQSITLDAGSGFASYLWSDGSTNQTLLVDEAFNTANGDVVSVEVTDNNTCIGADTTNVSFTICGALNGLGSELINSIYPNPTSEDINVEFSRSQKAVLGIYDLKGNLLLSEEIDAKKVKLRLYELPSAKYVLKIQGKEIDVQTGVIKN